MNRTQHPIIVAAGTTALVLVGVDRRTGS